MVPPVTAAARARRWWRDGGARSGSLACGSAAHVARVAGGGQLRVPAPAHAAAQAAGAHGGAENSRPSPLQHGHAVGGGMAAREAAASAAERPQ